MTCAKNVNDTRSNPKPSVCFSSVWKIDNLLSDCPRVSILILRYILFWSNEFVDRTHYPNEITHVYVCGLSFLLDTISIVVLSLGKYWTGRE